MFTPCSFSVALPALKAGEILRLACGADDVPAGASRAIAVVRPEDLPANALPVGTVLGAESGALLKIEGRAFWPGWERALFLARVLADISSGVRILKTARTGCALAVVTLSDKGFAGLREDESGPALVDMVRNALPLCHERRFLLPDEPARLRALVLELAGQGYDLVISTGGTGLSPRDLTPEALIPILDRRLPGFEQVMMAASLEKTPRAVLSRALAGTVGETLLFALPGSRRAALENLEVVLEAVPHALEKLGGDMSDCGRK